MPDQRHDYPLAEGEGFEPPSRDDYPLTVFKTAPDLALTSTNVASKRLVRTQSAQLNGDHRSRPALAGLPPPGSWSLATRIPPCRAGQRAITVSIAPVPGDGFSMRARYRADASRVDQGVGALRHESVARDDAPLRGRHAPRRGNGHDRGFGVRLHRVAAHFRCASSTHDMR